MSKHVLTRRGTMAGLGGLAAASLGSRARAEPTNLTVLSHEVMRIAATQGKGGDVTAAWQKANNCKITWITLDVNAIGDRLLREASLSETSIDLAYVQFTTPPVMSLMEPMEPFMASEPLDDPGPDLADFPPGLIQALKKQGGLRGLPVRVSSMGMLYNEAIMEERGVSALPKTFEELLEIARKTTFTRPDGSKVYGLMYQGDLDLTAGDVSFARSYGGDYLTGDMKIVANEAGNVKSVGTLAGLFKDGVLPPTTTNVSVNDLLIGIRQGMCCLSACVLAQLPTLNDPARSKYPGKIKAMYWPITETLAGKTPYAPTLVSWSLVMPRAAAASRKKLAWSFIRELTSKKATVAMGLNGNGPGRISAYSDPQLADIAYMPYMKNALQYGRIPMPAFTNYSKVSDIFAQGTQSVIIGRKPAQAGMDEAVALAKPLVAAG